MLVRSNSGATPNKRDGDMVSACAYEASESLQSSFALTYANIQWRSSPLGNGDLQRN